MKIFRTKYVKLNFWLDVVVLIAVCLALLYVFFWPVGVKGGSLSPAINNGDLLIVSRFLAYFGGVSQGDFVLARYGAGGYNENIVKRIAAVPGDHVIITGNSVYVNNQALEWDFFGHNAINIDLVLGEDQHFVLGHNLATSIDSRHFGAIYGHQIRARVLLRYFPLNLFQIY